MTKKSTKVRVVYDASASVRGSPSLNDCLHRGPVFLADLVGLFLRLRLAPIAVMSDIEKAFLMISVDETHRDLTRFLWFQDVSRGLDPENIIQLRFARVPFGLKSSPFLLTAVLVKHLDDDGGSLAQEIKRSLYMDNVFYTATSVEEAISKSRQAIEIFARAGMNLRQFVSNSSEVNKELGEPTETVTKFLGIHWNVQTDVLLPKLPEPSDGSTTETKRTVLSLTAAAYDPCGYSAPVTFRAKSFFQSLWKKKQYEWDTPLEETDARQWSDITSDWGSQLELPRLIVKGQPVSYQLISFTDASIKASAAAVYLRARYADHVQAHMIFAKTKLSPIKTPTIPRLELVGVLMGVRALQFVRTELHLPLELCSIFTDSSCVLNWILSGTENLPTFVLNRTREIRRAVNCAFGFVCTSDNPADVATRGLTVDELRSSNLWWHGPPWVCFDQPNWPEQPRFYSDADKLLREDDLQVMAARVATFKWPPMTDVVDVGRFSRLTRLVRSTAHFLRAVVLFLRPVSEEQSQLKQLYAATFFHTDVLTAREVEEATRFLIRQDQRANALKEEERLRWRVREGPKELLYCADRLQFSSLDDDRKNVVFLQRQSKLLKLFIIHLHEKGFHCGVQQTLASLRQQVYCPKGRLTVRSTIRQLCMFCRRHFAKPFRLPPFPPLPAERTQRADAFLNVGLDYLGPTTIRLPSGEVRKMWVLLLTCLVTRAVHLEIVLELTTAAFLRAFRRFIGRRRKPKIVISDNQTTFTLAAQVVNCGWDASNAHPDISNFMTTWEIDWRFIPALQPWQGGVYERMVGMFKKAFRVAAGRRTLPLDEAQTLVIEIESLINHRPLFYILDDQDVVILRPIDLVQPGENDPGLAFTVADADDDDEFIGGRMSSQAKLIKLQRKELRDADKFWNSFHDDYLPDQRDRRAFSHKQRHTALNDPRIGHVVIIKEDNTPRGLWKLGRIVSIRDAHRQQLRTADLQTKSGRVINRSIGHLHSLEVTDEELQRTPQAEVEAAPDTGPPAEELHNGPADDQPPGDDQPPEAETQREEVEAAEDAPEDAVRSRTNPRYTLRPNPRRTMPFMFAACNIVVMLLTPLLLAGGTSAAHSYNATTPPQNQSGRCNSEVDTKMLNFGSDCQRKGYVVYKDSPGFCYNEYNCPEGMHLRNVGSYAGSLLDGLNTSHFCGRQCRCDPLPEPYDSAVQGGCSFYKGDQTKSSSLRDWDARDILHSLKPPYCSFKPTLECPLEHGVYGNLVELYDGSFHFVAPLRLVHVQYDADDVRCTGTGRFDPQRDVEVTGTPEFCNVNNCTTGAKKFCSYLGGEKLFIESPLRRLLIKSWALVFTTVYLPDDTYNRRRLQNASWHKVKCRKDGFGVTSNIAGSQLQVCSGGYCRRFSRASNSEEVTFPRTYLLHPHVVQLKVWRNGHVFYQEEVECPATDICDLISCQFCAEIAHNPRCASALLIATITASVAVVITSLLASAGLAAYRGIAKWRRRQRMTLVPVQTTDQEFELESVFTGRESIGTQPAPSLRDVEVMTPATERRAKLRMPPFKTTTVVALACLAAMTMACSETSVMRVNSDLCIVNVDGHLNCSFSQASSVTVSNQGQTLCFLIKDGADVPYGTMTMSISPLELVCDPDTRHFVREFHMEVASSRRCGGMGSCDGDRCGSMNSSVIVPELEAVRMFRGYSKCFSSCGCWGCGCLLCSDACVFMRLLAKPFYRHHQPGHIFECFWHVESKVSVEIHLGNETHEMSFRTRLGKQTRRNGFVLTLNQVSLPPLPQLPRRFVSNHVKTAVLDPDQKTVTFDTNWMPFSNCTVPRDICSCQEARGVAHCDCDDSIYVLRNLDSPNHVLPRHEGPTWLHVTNKQVVADTFVGTAELRVSLEGLRLTLKAYNNTCFITPRKLSGCHSCRVGSKFEFGCRTDYGIASAHVNCPSADFLARCNASTIWQTQTMFLTTAEVNEQCEAVCVSNTTTFLLQGALDYVHGSHDNTSSPHVNSYTPEFRLGDIPKLMWKFLILPDLKIWLVTASVGIALAFMVALGWCAWMRVSKSALAIPLALSTMMPQTQALDHASPGVSDQWTFIALIVLAVIVIAGMARRTLTSGKRRNSQSDSDQSEPDTGEPDTVVVEQPGNSSNRGSPWRGRGMPLRGIMSRGGAWFASSSQTTSSSRPLRGRGASATSFSAPLRGRGASVTADSQPQPNSSTSARTRLVIQLEEELDLNTNFAPPILDSRPEEQPETSENSGPRYIGEGFSRRLLNPPPEGYGKPIPEEYLLDGNYSLPTRQAYRQQETLRDILALCDPDSLFKFRQTSRYCYETWQTNWNTLSVLSYLCGWCNSRNHGNNPCPEQEKYYLTEREERSLRRKHAARRRKRHRRALRRYLQSHKGACRRCGGNRCRPGWTCRGRNLITSSDEETSDDESVQTKRRERSLRSSNGSTTVSLPMWFLTIALLLPGVSATEPSESSTTSWVISALFAVLGALVVSVMWYICSRRGSHRPRPRQRLPPVRAGDRAPPRQRPIARVPPRPRNWNAAPDHNRFDWPARRRSGIWAARRQFEEWTARRLAQHQADRPHVPPRGHVRIRPEPERFRRVVVRNGSPDSPRVVVHNPVCPCVNHPAGQCPHHQQDGHEQDSSDSGSSDSEEVIRIRPVFRFPRPPPAYQASLLLCLALAAAAIPLAATQASHASSSVLTATRSLPAAIVTRSVQLTVVYQPKQFESIPGTHLLAHKMADDLNKTLGSDFTQDGELSDAVDDRLEIDETVQSPAVTVPSERPVPGPSSSSSEVTRMAEQLKVQAQELSQRMQQHLQDRQPAKKLPLRSVVVATAAAPPAAPSVPSQVGVVTDPKRLVVTDQTSHGLKLSCLCDSDIAGHENCKPILLGDLEPTFTLTKEKVEGVSLATLRVRSVLQLMFVKYALSDGYKTHREQFLLNLLRDSPAQATALFHSYRAMRKEPTIPNVQQLKQSWELRVQTCNVAKEALVGDAYQAISFSTSCYHIYKETQADVYSEWRNLFSETANQLELVRMDEVHRGKRRITPSTVIIGDTLIDEMTHHINRGYFSIVKKRADDLITALDTAFVLSSSVKKVIVMLGRDELVNGATAEEILNMHVRLAARLMRYRHVEVYWVHPPFVHIRQDTWKHLVRHYDMTICDAVKKQPHQKHRFVTHHKEFSMAQIFRCGLGHFDYAIDAKGKPTPIGFKLLVSYLSEVWNMPVSLRRSDGAVNDTVPPPPPPPRGPVKRSYDDRDHGRSKKQKRSDR